MFLHHIMTDSEILRSCEGCTSQHLRLVADRLRDRVDDLRRIALEIKEINSNSWEDVAAEIEIICKEVK